MPGRSDYAGHQSVEYRRGFVLGLTLAEAMLLLLFVILLLLLLGFERREKEIEDLREIQERFAFLAEGREDQELLRLIEKAEVLAELEQSEGVEISDDFIELVQQMVAESRSSGVDLVKKLEEQNEEIEALQEELEAFSELGSPESIQEDLELAAADESTLRGQVAEMRRRLEAAGNGRVLPSCWSTEDGKTQYLMDITLVDEGILAQETIPEGRESSRARLPLSNRDLTEPLSIGQFLAWTREVFRYSVAEECRFYVRVQDSTGPMMKERFKALLLTVENHFYKLLLKA